MTPPNNGTTPPNDNNTNNTSTLDKDEYGVIYSEVAQVLYTYKDLGYSEIYITKELKVVNNMADVILNNGLDELAVNINVESNTYETKNVKIIYYYQDNSKTFTNHIINASEDELTFKLKKIIEFINKEYKSNISLVSYQRSKYFLTVDLECDEEDVVIIKKLIKDNINVKEENIIIR